MAVSAADDPRDTLGPSSAALPAPRAVTTITTSSTTNNDAADSSHYPPTSSHPRRPYPIHTALPQSRFSFEYQVPHRDRSSTSHRSSALQSPYSVGPDPTPTPQRSFLYDGPRRSVPNFSLSNIGNPSSSAAASFAQPSPPLSATERHSSFALPLDADSSLDALSPNASKRRKHLSQQTLRVNAKQRMPASTLTYGQGRANGDRAVHRVDNRASEDLTGRTDDTTRSKNEDVFLNIARSDSGRRDSFSRSELRRSRFGLSGQSLRSPTSRVHDPTPSPDQPRFNNPDTPLHSSNDYPSTLPYGSVTRTHSLSAHPLDDHSRRHSNIGPSSRSTIGLPRSRLGRTSPEASPESSIERRASLQDPRLYRHSGLSTIRSNRQPSGSEATERPRIDTDKARQDGTESTLSTNAPSTVWDELEDLKSRIRKLELTGKLPPSSQAAISSVSGERPRTATTTVTTLSSSPKTSRKASAPYQEPDTAAALSQVHPLLQSALVKSKSALKNDVYKALESTVTDALALSTLLGSGNSPSHGSSVVNGFGQSDRQSRRKADSVCRGLTELCLALSDNQQPSSVDDHAGAPQQNGSHEEPPVPTLPLQRAATFEPESISRRQSTTRVTSRLESRRASLANLNVTNNEPPPPLPDTKPTQTQTQTQPPAKATPRRLSRLSSLRTRKTMDDENAEDENPHKRTISRSMTIGTPTVSNRVPPRQRASHGYTGSRSVLNSQQDQNESFTTPSQPPPPEQQVPRTPTLSQSNIPLRRTFMSPVTPATTRSNIQAGSRRYGFGSSYAPSNADRATESNGDVAPPPSQSQTRIIAPSQKIAASYTPIPQNRARANSLGVRRFGLRQRPMTSAGSAVNALDDSID
ncbi:hypothetical protein ASPWEDRAFT_105973 [Aspergillus wentii DTO 134E9]|uniref:LPXTG-motif cell wall anchor domain protein n=1 Tax=Aspergillus wentii DTO 134E9 TaxID=1073089 RepID=A0A1L9RVQ6_ASPWE|nr:uncharacterized protein ASPWEDRAFT_105973 [Aspergillus wentii DTO 134E9]OJJ39002.1 hypothetical protein ASPWEDRAFT_105973 [Aspergillus wentii DTO 134E9]